MIHALVEHLFALPEAEQLRAAEGLLAGYLGDTEEALAEALSTVRCVHLTPYRENALAEVAFTARLPELGGALVNGTIDLLRVDEKEVRILDFKSNATVPETAASVPLGILRQMGAYRAAIKQIYPDHDVITEIYWTATNQLMPLDCAQVDAALRAATAS